ncbi:MAG: pyridoxal-phosphate dependent enzyme [Candidatus Lokiarchaeota archaeon]|nr:pyridoxal-phosphate dependent enzyme [Candidatus Lokiarchaeota archaeon]MBD3337942.1 pyridoxal-phosphate dependent enzyme [Candidatus Lokiarchaeota archaeon]
MVEYKDVKGAYKRVKDAVNKTPVMTSRTLNEITQAQVFLKCENFQRIGAFKMRGAYNAISQLSNEQKKRGVITHSSGNHAQAVALAANLLNIDATIVMPKTSPQVKVNATRDSYNATVVFCEPTIEARQKTADKLINENGYTLIHPFDNDNVIAGAGTAAYELLNEIKDLEMILAPVGGGGLLSGTSIAAKGFNSKIKVYGVEPENVDDAYRSYKSGEVETNETINSISDGLLTNLSERTLNYIRKHVDDIILVSEQEILDSMKFLWERMKLVVEPSGATSLAGVMFGDKNIKNKRIGVIISGGNVDLNQFFETYSQRLSGN